MTERHDPPAQRRQWLAVLARSAGPRLEEALRRHGAALAHQAVRPAEVGMAMVRGRIGGTGDAFNLGEATVTRCAVRVGEHLGVGYTLGRDIRKAELIALIDALLQEPATGEALRQELVEPLAREQAQQRDAVSRAAAASRVEFFTMVREAA